MERVGSPILPQNEGQPVFVMSFVFPRTLVFLYLPSFLCAISLIDLPLNKYISQKAFKHQSFVFQLNSSRVSVNSKDSLPKNLFSNQYDLLICNTKPFNNSK